MRELRFKIWEVRRRDEETGGWIETHKNISFKDTGLCWAIECGEEHYRIYQFINKLDKNGVKIFEGDILMQRFTTMGGIINGEKVPYFGRNSVKLDFEREFIVKDIFTELPEQVMYGDCTYEIVGHIEERGENTDR